VAEKDESLRGTNGRRRGAAFLPLTPMHGCQIRGHSHAHLALALPLSPYCAPLACSPTAALGASPIGPRRHTTVAPYSTGCEALREGAAGAPGVYRSASTAPPGPPPAATAPFSTMEVEGSGGGPGSGAPRVYHSPAAGRAGLGAVSGKAQGAEVGLLAPLNGPNGHVSGHLVAPLGEDVPGWRGTRGRGPGRRRAPGVPQERPEATPEGLRGAPESRGMGWGGELGLAGG